MDFSRLQGGKKVGSKWCVTVCGGRRAGMKTALHVAQHGTNVSKIQADSAVH